MTKKKYLQKVEYLQKMEYLPKVEQGNNSSN
jgi:hypothetical protein